MIFKQSGRTLYAFGNGNRKPSNPLVSGHAPLVARPRSEPPAVAGGLCLIARTSYDLKINRPLPRAVLTHPCPKCYAGPNRLRYSVDVMNAFTISAATKLPLKEFSLFS